MNILVRVFDQMARMGLAFKSDPIKRIEIEGREFGPVAGGFDMSIALPKDQKDLVAVILRNVEPVEKRLLTRGWLHFLHVHLTSPDGSEAALSPYGREALKPERAKSDVVLHFAPNEMVETEIPLGILYEMDKAGTYRVRVSCQLPDTVLSSNECSFVHGDLVSS
jgi:hypothetical protein